MVLIRRGLFWNAVLVLFQLGFCDFCPDLSTECYAISISNDTSLCNLEIIRDVCRTTCEVERLDCLTPCSTFNYTGYEAFIFYAIGLFLLLIIGILSYTYFVDSKPTPALLSRRKKKEIQLAGWPNQMSESSLGIGSNPNIDSLNKIQSPSDDYGDEQRNRNERYPQGSIFANVLKSEEMKRSSYELKNSHPPQVAPINSYPASVMKGSIRGGHELDEADGAEYLDEDDDFFKYALIPEEDSYHSDFVPPAPCRAGGPRQSQALSKKLKARDAAHPKRNKAISSLPLQHEAHIEPRKKQRRNGAQKRSITPNERCPSTKERHPSRSPGDHLSTPHRANKIPLNSSDHSSVNRLNDTLRSLPDIGDEAERISDLRISGEPSEDPAGHKRPMVKQINSKKDWYAVGQGRTRGHWGSCASEGIEPHDQLQKRHGHEGIEQERLPNARGQEIQKVNEGRWKTNNSLPYSFPEGEADRGEPSPSPSPSPSIIKTDPDEKASDTTGDDLTFGRSRSSKTMEHTSPKERDQIWDGEVIVTSAVKA